MQFHCIVVINKDSCMPSCFQPTTFNAGAAVAERKAVAGRKAIAERINRCCEESRCCRTIDPSKRQEHALLLQNNQKAFKDPAATSSGSAKTDSSWSSRNRLVAKYYTQERLQFDRLAHIYIANFLKHGS
jgi:hypothetical protein